MNKSEFRHKLILVLRLVVSFGILIYLIKILNWERLSYVFSHLRLEYVWLGPVLLILGLYCAAIRWSLLLRFFQVKLTKKKSFIYYLVGNFYNIILPGAIGGDLVRVGICAASKQKSIAVIATSALLERAFGLLLVFLLGTVATLFLPNELKQQLGSQLVTTLPLLSGVFLLFLLMAWLLMRSISPEWLKSKTEKIPLFSKLVSLSIDLLNQLKNIPLTALLAVVGFSALFQAFDIVASYFLAKAILINLPIVVFFVAIPIVYLSTILPISLGGLGVREGVLAFLLARVGIQSSDAVTLSFMLYLNRVCIGLIGGMIQIFWHLPVNTRKILKK